MQIPMMKTPVSKCVNLARFAETMFSKFPQNKTLTALSGTLAAARTALSAAQHAYVEAVSEIVHARAEVRFIDYASDNGVRGAARKVEDADGRKNGRIASIVFPAGMTPVIKPVGATQVREMRDLEGRLEAVAGTWSAAAAEKAAITGLRTSYEAALEARRAAAQKASDKRAARDAAKEDFLDVYAEVAARLKAEFPRDRPMQDLFFDAVADASSSEGEAGSDEDEVGGGEGGASEGGAPA